MSDTTTRASARSRAHQGERVGQQGWSRFLVPPRGETAARLTLLGVVLFLQNALEFPRSGVVAALGRPLTDLLVVLALGGSLALLLVALRPRLPSWRWPRSRRVQAVVLGVTLLACLAGIHQVGTVLSTPFRPPDYPNDGTTLDHAAAQQVIEGHNPYRTVTIVAANQQYGQPADHTTPLRCGVFANRPWSSYPTKAELTAAFQQAKAGVPAAICAFESHVSYPALAFLPLVPFTWAGLPSVVPFFGLCFFVLAAILLLSVPAELRVWVGVLVLADTPLLDATAGGVLDVLYILLLAVAWRWWQRPILSALFLGLALAAKQLAWFFLPYYAILVWREYGWRAAAARIAGAGAVFLAINLPFIVSDPHAWLTGVLAPQVDPMFPLGSGLIKLSLDGLAPLAPQIAYTALEGLALLACVAWYWRNVRRMPESGFVLAVVPLFFAWRSLTTYFYFVAVPSVVLLLAREWQTGRLAMAQRVPDSTFATERGKTRPARMRGPAAVPRRRQRRLAREA